MPINSLPGIIGAGITARVGLEALNMVSPKPKKKKYKRRK